MPPGVRSVAKHVYLELLRFLPDRFVISLDYLRVFGAFPDLARPHRFSEKMQHFKLGQRDPKMPGLVDKVRVKAVVSSLLGDEWIIPTLWHGRELTEAVLGAVPKPAVVKPNHSSAHVMFVHANANLANVARKAKGWLGYDHHVLHREWPYGQVQREILIEPFIGGADPPDDYKFWVFDGAVSLVQVDQSRFRRHMRQFYTPAWTRLDLKLIYPEPPANLPPPRHLTQMLRAAATLANGFRFARVDLYDTPKGPLFGEITFAPEAGLCCFEPKEFDFKLGEAWSYPGPASETESLQALADAFKLRERRK